MIKLYEMPSGSDLHMAQIHSTKVSEMAVFHGSNPTWTDSGSGRYPPIEDPRLEQDVAPFNPHFSWLNQVILLIFV